MIGDVLQRLPLRGRLTLAFAIVMIVLFGGLALLLHTRFSASLDDGTHRALSTRAFDLSTLVLRDNAGRLGSPAPLPERGGAFAQILDARGRILDATPGHGTRPLLTAAEIRRARTEEVTIGRRDNARVLARPLATSPPTVLVVGVSLAQNDRALHTLDDLLFIGGPLLLVLTCLGGYALAASALAPVERMRARAERISGAERGDRLPVPVAHDELHRLGDTLNQMLGRVEDAMAGERAFVANAGHELRTPLAILQLELELALSGEPPREELKAALLSTAEEVERLNRLADDLLVIARADQGKLPVQKRPVEVDRLLTTLGDRLADSARRSERVLTTTSAGNLTVAADEERLEQALTNMVTNALRYGRGPVELTALEHNAHVELHVRDDGDGFDPDFLPRAFERFSRADPARSSGGTGLGLSIVKAIAEAHGGRARAANRPGGGADVWVELPR
jgi:two-component system OmpR family sensor kinase